jgi:3-oxoacyl-[acyl-carrier protein] reductase
MRVILTGRDTEALELVRCGLSNDRTHICIPADFERPEEITRLVSEISTCTRGLDLLILNAGFAAAAQLEDTTISEWDRTFAVNVRAPFLLSRDLLPLLRAATGRIIVIGSVVSEQAYFGQGAYTASKHALSGLTKVLAKELHEEGILVQIINPGGVDTEMFHRLRPEVSPETRISPDDVADAVVTLLDQNPSAVTDAISLRRRNKAPWS